MSQSANDEIKARRERNRHVAIDHRSTVWLQELADEITRLRHDLREFSELLRKREPE